MALKVIAVDDKNVQHLIIGLSRENIDSLVRGDVFRLPGGPVPVLTENEVISCCCSPRQTSSWKSDFRHLSGRSDARRGDSGSTLPNVSLETNLPGRVILVEGRYSMTSQAQALQVAEPRCPECGQELRRATAFDGSPSNATAQFLWCANESCAQFGVMKQKNMYGKKVRGIERSTFVLDREGRVAREWRGVKVPGHVEEVLNFVKAL